MKRAPAPWLIAIVGASFLVRTVVGWLRATPVLFPDEYIYSAIGRSVAESGQPLIRGGAAHFPAILQPVLTAPAWLIGDVDVAYRLVQAIGALAMSLAAVPVYLLARRLGLSQRIGLALGALAIFVPDLVYASFVASEPFAYPLVLAAVTAATAALTRPTRRAQLAFVLFAVLAMLARAQFLVLPVVFFVASLVVGACERRIRSALREQLLPLGLFLLPALGLVLSGPARTLGYYSTALHLRLHPISFLHWAGWDLMVLAYAAGWIIVPGAALGLWLAFARPHTRAALAFAAMTSTLAIVLVGEAGLLQANSAGQASIYGVDEIKERYLFYLVPLVGLCFALYAKRGWPLRIPHLALAAGLVVVSVRVPLSGFANGSTLDASPILYAVHWLGGELGRPGDAAGVVAAAAGVMSAAAVLASRRPRLGTPAVLGLALLALGTASAGAVAFDVGNADSQRRAFLPDDPSWVDRARVGRTVLLQSGDGIRAASLQELFWNRSIDRVLLLPTAVPIDSFSNQRVSIGKDGTLLAAGRPIAQPLLVDGYGSTVRLRGARMLEAGPTASLWAPTGRVALSLYATGRYHDGWLADRGTISVWPGTGRTLSGWLSARLSAPHDAGAAVVTFQVPGGRAASVQLRPGAQQRVRIAVCATGAWRATYRSSVHRIVDVRVVSVRASAPTFTPDRSACPAAEAREMVDR